MSKRLSFFIVFVVFFTYATSYADQVGSDTAVSIIPNYLFPASPIIPNQIEVFGWMKNGFALADNTTTCTFNSVFPVSGTVNLNNGTLSLSQDLLFSNLTTLQNGGHYIGNYYKILLPTGMPVLPSSPASFSNTTIQLQANLTVNSVITFYGNSTIAGNGYTLTLGPSGALVAASGSMLSLWDIELQGVGATNISCADDSAHLVVNDVAWIQSSDFNFNNGSMLFIGANSFAGAYTFAYASAQTSTLTSNAQWIISNNLKLSIGRKQSVNYVEPLYFVDNTSTIKFDNASLLVTANGMQSTNGVMIFDHTVNLDIQSTTTTYGWSIGNGQAANDFVVLFNSGASLNFNSGYFIYNNFLPTQIQTSSKTATVTRFGNSKAYVQRTWTLPPWILNVNGLPLTTIPAGIQLGYNNVHLIFGPAEMDFTGFQDALQNFYLLGNDSLSVSKGTVPLNIIVGGTGNQINGAGNMGLPVTLQDSNTQLSSSLLGQYLQNIDLNGGAFTLAGNLFLGQSVGFTGSGTVNLAQNQCAFEAQDFSWTGTTLWTGNNGQLIFQANLALTSPLTFNGSCLINGNGNVLDLGATGSLIVASNSNLTLKNVILKNVSGTNIACADDTANIILDGVTWLQDNNYTFNAGSLIFKNNNNFSGNYSFFYSSDQTSTINSHSQWTFSDGMTLSIGRKNAVNYVEPLNFVDRTSVLFIDNSTLLVTANGMQSTNGTLIFDHLVNLDIVSTASQSGWIDGNGNPANDFLIQFNSGASMNFNSGVFVYNNSVPNLIQVTSQQAWVTRFSGSHAYLATNWTLPPWQLEVIGAPTTIIPPGRTLAYQNTHLIFPQCSFDFSGSQSSFSVFFLTGNDPLYMTKGTLPVPLVVSGTGNSILGSGNIGMPVTLQDSNTQLTCNLNGFFLQNINMNNGTLLIASEMALGSSVALTGSGAVNLSYNQIDFGPVDMTWTSSVSWTGNNGTIALYALLDLDGTWTINGSVIINGQGNTIDLTEGKIVIANNATLTLKDVQLLGVNNTNISCLGNGSVLILDNVTWIQSNNYVFSQGSILIKDYVTMKGTNYNFAYQSTNVSTIASHATLSLDNGLTFSYDPTNNSPTLLTFADSTAILALNGATLHATMGGLNLSDGSLSVKHDSSVACEGPTLSTGITIGTGQPGQDMILEIADATKLFVTQGALDYKNLNASSWIMHSANSRLSMQSGTVLNLFETINLGNGVIEFFGNNILAQAAAAQINGSVFTLGTLSYAALK